MQSSSRSVPARFVAAFFISITISMSISHARILNVPEDFQTIQAGINTAEDGDTILVEPGVYSERISFGGRDVFLIGRTESPESVVIDGGEEGTVVSFTNGETQRAVLDGFTIRRGVGQDGGGIVINRADPTLRNLIVRENAANRGGGIFCYNASPTLFNIVLTGNECEQWGAALYAEGGARLTLNRILVVRNSSGDGDVRGINLYQVLRADLTNVTIAGNEGPGNDLQISASRTNVVTNLVNCILWEGGGEVLVDFQHGGSNVVNVSYTDASFIMPNGPNAVVNWGDGNIDTDPLFLDPDNGDYSLSPDSPCIDAGDLDSPLDPDGTRADMGAFYFHQRDIYIDVEELHFPPIAYGEIDSLSVEIRNRGNTDLLMFGFSVANNHSSFFTRDSLIRDTLIVEPLSEYIGWVYYVPDPEAASQSWLQIRSNDPDEPEIIVEVTGQVMDVESDKRDAYPTRIEVSAFPNPFNSMTTIRFSTDPINREATSLAVYDINGRMVAKLSSAVASPQAMGRKITPPTPPAIAGGDRAGSSAIAGGDCRTVVWNAEGLPGGIYFVKLESGSQTSAMKVVLMR